MHQVVWCDEYIVGDREESLARNALRRHFEKLWLFEKFTYAKQSKAKQSKAKQGKASEGKARQGSLKKGSKGVSKGAVGSSTEARWRQRDLVLVFPN